MKKVIIAILITFMLALPSISAYIMLGGGDGSYFKGSIDEITLYNRSLTLKEIERLYNKGINGNGSCDLFFTDPDYSNFSVNLGTTNFSANYNLGNVTNMSLVTSHGMIKFAADHGVYADDEDYDSNVIIGDCFVAVDTAHLDPTFNYTAELTLNNSDGHCGDDRIYQTDSFLSSASAIRNAGQECDDCNILQKTNNHLTKFRVQHFSSYAIGSNARLDIYDEYEGTYVDEDVDVTFFANYTNSTSGAHLSGAMCKIRFDSNMTEFSMVDTGSNYNYTLSGGFSTLGEHIFHVNCSITGYNTLNTSDTVQVGPANVPEFSVITLGLGLFVVLIGLVAIRRHQ